MWCVKRRGRFAPVIVTESCTSALEIAFDRPGPKEEKA